MSLADNKCIPCEGGVPPLDDMRAKDLLMELHKDWFLNDLGHLERSIKLNDFDQSIKIANEVAKIANEENHHPDLFVSWGLCKIEIWTHKIDGLTESDFFLAAKVDRSIV